MPSQGSSDQVTSAGIVTINLSAVAVENGPATDDGSLLCAEKDCNCETAGVAAVSAEPRAPEAEAIKEAEVTGTPETADKVTGTTSEDEEEATDEVTGAEAVDEVRPDSATDDEVRPGEATVDPEPATRVVAAAGAEVAKRLVTLRARLEELEAEAKVTNAAARPTAKSSATRKKTKLTKKSKIVRPTDAPAADSEVSARGEEKVSAPESIKISGATGDGVTRCNALFTKSGKRNGQPCFNGSQDGGALYFDGSYWKLCNSGTGSREVGWNFSQEPSTKDLALFRPPLGKWTEAKKTSETKRDYSGLTLTGVDCCEDYSSEDLFSEEAGVTGCDASCRKRHDEDGECLNCGMDWGPHNGHMCTHGDHDGERGSWAVAAAVCALPSNDTDVYKKRTDFSSKEQYVRYLKETLEVGMRVRGISGSRDGDTGVYSLDDGSESPQFTWDQFGSTWFTSLSDVEILAGDSDSTTDDSEDDEMAGSLDGSEMEQDDSELSAEEEDEDAEEEDEDAEEEDAADSQGDASSALPLNKWLCGSCKKWKVDAESGLGEVTCSNGPSVFHSEQSVIPGQPGVISWKMKVCHPFNCSLLYVWDHFVPYCVSPCMV
jgi:hypothetical protein